MYTPISHDMLAQFESAFTADPVNQLRMHAVVKNGLNDAAENHLEDAGNPMIFSIELESGKITNQKSSGRCWLFAGLNTMRHEIMQTLNLKNFELSQNHPLFYDKLEKANYFLESALKTREEPLDGRLVSFLFANPMQDGGQWDMFSALVEKYGCVPKSVMPETFHSSNTADMNRLLTVKLREDALALRAAKQDHQQMKNKMLAEIYQMLAICLGTPPQRFDFEYRDKDDVFHRDAGLTPLDFYKKYGGQALDQYVSIINAPTADKPYEKTYTVDYLGNVAGARPIKYLNLPSEQLKKLAIAQLGDGRPVWFGCDVGKMLMRKRGIMGLRGFDYEKLLGVSFGMDKADRLDTGESMLTHAMVFLGVNIDESGKPNRWKVENSWSDERGQDGYYIMTDEWFDEFNYQVVIDKKYLSDAQRAAFAQAPIVLKPWDPMGSLA
jgi:bleomycin hydrolase